MIEQQIRPWEVLDQTVLDLMGRMPRERFVPDSFRRLAYADISVPIHEDEQMMPPRLEARLVQSLQLESHDAVLEIGTGSGFLTALLAGLVRHVTTVEIIPSLSEGATARLAEMGVENVTFEVGDGVRGWLSAAPYDAIAVTGSIPILDDEIQNQLKVGGRLFVIVGEAPSMEALLITRTALAQWSRESMFETVVPALHGAKQPERFVL